MPTIFVFGNPDVPEDALPLQIIKKLNLPEINFQTIDPNDDIPPVGHPIIFDTVVGLTDITVLTEQDLDKIVASPTATAHDHDLGFQLKYLRKLGKIKGFTLVGIPPEWKVDINKFVSVLQSIHV